MELVWHYTAGGSFPQIIRSGVIELAHRNVPEGIPCAAWFSSNQEWERTTTRRLEEENGTLRLPTLAELDEYLNGLCRIGVSKACLLSWCDLKGMIQAAPAECHESLGRKMGGNPDEWFASLKPVYSDRWLAVEKWSAQSQSWVSMNWSDDGEWQCPPS